MYAPPQIEWCSVCGHHPDQHEGRCLHVGHFGPCACEAYKPPTRPKNPIYVIQVSGCEWGGVERDAGFFRDRALAEAVTEKLNKEDRDASYEVIELGEAR